MVDKKYIKSPLNYVGGKYKLLNQIIPLFPEKVGTFVDLFGGGFNVGANIECDKFIYNDKCCHVAEILGLFYWTNTESLLSQINELIERYSLSKENSEGFLALRKDYNDDPSPIKLYTLICYAFNYQIRFNKKGEYNMPFGKDRSSFNPKLRKNFVEFVDTIGKKNGEFFSCDFKEIDLSNLTSNDLVYVDSPYLGSTACYNEQGGWTEKEETELLELLDKLNEKGIKFALSNNLKYDNPILDKWKDKYNVHYLNMDYSNCNYQKKDKSKDIEVLITNY